MVDKSIHSDIHWMNVALEEALKAGKAGEVPIGAVAVRDGRLISKAYNKNIGLNDPSAHAEIVTLKKAARKLKNHRLNDITIYTTIEPCPMCMGAMIYARIKGVVYGAKDPKAGACGSVIALHRNKKLNHSVIVKGGVLASEASRLIKGFFKKRR